MWGVGSLTFDLWTLGFALFDRSRVEAGTFWKETEVQTGAESPHRDGVSHLELQRQSPGPSPSPAHLHHPPPAHLPAPPHSSLVPLLALHLLPPSPPPPLPRDQQAHLDQQVKECRKSVNIKPGTRNFQSRFIFSNGDTLNFDFFFFFFIQTHLSFLFHLPQVYFHQQLLLPHCLLQSLLPPLGQ